MSVVTLPSKLMRGGVRDREPRRRGITRVKELLAAGVNVAYGQDVIQDGFIKPSERPGLGLEELRQGKSTEAERADPQEIAARNAITKPRFFAVDGEHEINDE